MRKLGPGTKIMLAILVAFAAVTALVVWNNRQPDSVPSPDPSANEQQATPVPSQPAPSETIWHKVVKEEDFSIKAIEGKLSDNSLEEVRDAPMDERYQYRVVVKAGATEEELRTLTEVLVQKLPSALDEASFFYYREGTDTGGEWTVGKADWAPNGEWGTVTPDIARSDDRSNYKINVQLAEQPVPKPKRSSSTRGLTEEKRRAIFWELVSAEDRAAVEAERRFPTSSQDMSPEGNVEKNAELTNKLSEKYKARVQKKYRLSDKQVMDIQTEGMSENWPTPDTPDLTVPQN